GENHRVTGLPALGQLFQLTAPSTVAHDQCGCRNAATTKLDRGVDQQLLPLAVVVEVADVAEGELAFQAEVRHQFGGTVAWLECVDVDAVGHHVHAFRIDAALHDLVAHRLAQRHHGVGLGHAPVLGVTPAPVDLRGFGPSGVGGPQRLEEAAHLVDHRDAEVPAEGQPHQGGFEPAVAGVDVDDGGRFGPDYLRGRLGVVLQ